MYRINQLPQTDWQTLNRLLPVIGGEPGAMLKALTADAGVNATSFTGGRALTYENLDPMLQSVNLSADDHALWRALDKRAIHATVDQFNRRTAYTNARWGNRVAETANPTMHIAQIARAYETVKYYRDRRAVSDVATLMHTVDRCASERR